MNYIGISNSFHDAALSIVNDNGEILFAGHSERYSKIKHDKNLCYDLVVDAKNYLIGETEVHYYERPWLTALRQLRAGQPVDSFTSKARIGKQILHLFNDPKVKTHNHHLSHAAAGFQTSPFNDATVIVIDAIGEFETITIWNAWYDCNGIARYKKIHRISYPNSVGLFYSAMTKKAGLRPLDEEYILMGMAAYGEPIHQSDIVESLFHDSVLLECKENLHIGIPDNILDGALPENIAATAQLLTEKMIRNILSIARYKGASSNLVYGGGVALNCLANQNLGNYFKNIWIMPNPGDAGSSLGAAALGFRKKLKWNNAYLGYHIPGPYPANKAVDELLKNQIVGIASGRAEFGPRALGNRSLLADPRSKNIKDRVNEIKHRQKFRPFAPVIMEEHVHKYFEMPVGWENSRYMQVVAKCKFPDLFPGIVHVDGTSRVQTVARDNSGIRELLEKWYIMSECPMLLNTSLNIRGEPMVNDRKDADRFEKLYNVKVLS